MRQDFIAQEVVSHFPEARFERSKFENLNISFQIFCQEKHQTSFITKCLSFTCDPSEEAGILNVYREIDRKTAK